MYFEECRDDFKTSTRFKKNYLKYLVRIRNQSQCKMYSPRIDQFDYKRHPLCRIDDSHHPHTNSIERKWYPNTSSVDQGSFYWLVSLAGKFQV